LLDWWWKLPTKEELVTLSGVRSGCPTLGFANGVRYWSSDEYGSAARYVSIGISGSQTGYHNKEAEAYVICVHD
jgi:hypothetical protein